jgi:murein DD-endopeptidase MepM/ murein hydrolase activator NlpD
MIKSYRISIIIAVVVVILAAGSFFFMTYGEFEKPAIHFTGDISAIGQQKVIEMALTDNNSGIRSAAVSITQDNKTYPLGSFDFPQRGVHAKTVSVTADSMALKLKEGPATLIATVIDHSLWQNQTTISRQVTIDLMPPQIQLTFGQVNNISPGGTCVVIFRTSKPLSAGGVEVENRTFPGYAATIAGKPSMIVYFPLSMKARNGQTPIRVAARDMAGNVASLVLPSLILDKKFRSDSVNLSDTFLQKMGDFQIANPDLRGKPPIDVFVAVNTKLREANFKAIQDLCQKSESKQLWEGAFLRMKNASPMALYGDSRTYVFNGKSVGESIHLGVDLASTAHAPIEASNSGTVVFTGPMGIYGNTVIIDHGFGIFSLYAHLSSIATKAGMSVKKGGVIGQSGATGLAGGDHLHFSIIVGGEFVNPVEWWDAHWIADNVNKKLQAAQ